MEQQNLPHQERMRLKKGKKNWYTECGINVQKSQGNFSPYAGNKSGCAICAGNEMDRNKNQRTGDGFELIYGGANNYFIKRFKRIGYRSKQEE